MPAPLFPTEGNPVPETMSAGYLDTPAGRKIRFALTQADIRAPKGTIIILHGRNESIEKYFETIVDLQSRGFATATFDWTGQGGSDRTCKDPHRGFISDFNDYVDDLDTFMTGIVLPDCRGPFYILGHSTGSLAALLAAPKLANRIRRMVLLAPLLGLSGMPVSHATIRRASWLARLTGLGNMYFAGGPRPRETRPFAGNKLTTDERRYRRNSGIYEAHPDLALGGPTAAWVNASCRAIDAVTRPDFKAAIMVPTLIIAAGADRIVSNSAIEQFLPGFRAGGLVTVDGANHELLQERDFYREQALAAFDAFIPGTGAQFP